MRCQIEHFSRSYRVIAADNRSHGKSDNGPGDLNYEQMTDDLAVLLQKLKIEKVDVIGQSDGAILGLLLAMRYPSQVRAVVASAPNLRPDSVADWAVAWIENDLKDAKVMLAKGNTSRDWTRVKQMGRTDAPRAAHCDFGPKEDSGSRSRHGRGRRHHSFRPSARDLSQYSPGAALHYFGCDSFHVARRARNIQLDDGEIPASAFSAANFETVIETTVRLAFRRPREVSMEFASQ